MRLSYDCMLREILHLVDKRAIAKNDNQTNVFLVYFAKFHLYISLKKDASYVRPSCIFLLVIIARKKLQRCALSHRIIYAKMSSYHYEMVHHDYLSRAICSGYY